MRIVQDSDFTHFFEDGIKSEVPSEIKPPSKQKGSQTKFLSGNPEMIAMSLRITLPADQGTQFDVFKDYFK